MGKKRDLRRAIRRAGADPLPAPVQLTAPQDGDEELVQINMVLTEGDRRRLKLLGLYLDNTSLQRLGHRAWNALLASHGQPGLTPVLTGVRGRAPVRD